VIDDSFMIKTECIAPFEVKMMEDIRPIASRMRKWLIFAYTSHISEAAVI